MEIGEPAVLARIARSPIEDGRVFLTQVYSLADGLKRRRQELCAAIDGDSVNVYEIRQGRNLSSYPIPPDSVLLCPPCSLRSKSVTGKPTRCTYFASVRRNETGLTVFQEESGGNDRKIFSKSLPLDNTTARVVQLEVLPESDTHQVLVIWDDGQYEIYNADLSLRLKHGQFPGLTDGARLVAAQWFSPRHAQKSILRARPDIAVTSDLQSSFVLGVFFCPTSQNSGITSNVQLAVWQLSSARSSLSTETATGPLLHHKLPISSALVPQERDPVTFSSRETRLIIKTQNKQYAFDLTSTTFRKLYEMPLAGAPFNSVFISDSLTISSTATSLQLYNTQFQTIQTKLDLNKTGSKRKRGSGGGQVWLSAYSPALNRVIALRHGNLVAIDLRISDNSDFASAARQSSLLISNIGRGAIHQDYLKDRAGESLVGQKTKQSEAIEQWQNSMKKLEECLQEKAFAKFEQIWLEQAAEKATRGPKESIIVTNHKIDYVLARILEYDAAQENSSITSSQRLKLAFPAHKILESLATRGLLTNERVNKALKTNTRSNLEVVKYGAVSELIMDCDPALNLLRSCLQGAPHIAHEELCAAILLLLRRALAESKVPSSLTIEDAKKPNSVEDGALDATTTKPEESIGTNVTTCLCVAVERLAETGQGFLSKFMQDSFNQEEIIALVQFLRQQLFRSGYTRSLRAQLYPSPPPSEHGQSVEGEKHDAKPEVSLTAITSTLSCCLDAIGPIGVLNFRDDDAFFQTLVPELSSEIARATEAVQESVFLEGMLRETLRFVESVPRTHEQGVDPEQGPDTQQHKPGSIMTLYSESATDGGLGQNSSLLPLSLRADNGISGIRVRKGNGMVYRRSERDMGLQQDRLRGSYALERLVL